MVKIGGVSYFSVRLFSTFMYFILLIFIDIIYYKKLQLVVFKDGI